VKPVLLFITSTSSPLASPLITPVQWSVEQSSATSICLTSLSPLQRPRSSVSQTSPGLCSVLTPHTLVRACLPGLKAPSPRPSPLHSRLARLYTAVHQAIPLPPVRRPLLFVDRRASRLDHLTRPPPPLTSLSPDCCIHRTSYKAPRASVFIKPKGKSIFRVVCLLEPYPKHISDSGLDLDFEIHRIQCKEQQRWRMQ
jgi:hypothetical protein